jgi:predicted Rossmann fold flavoprotein
MQKTDVIIIGAGAAGLFCAIEAGKRGRRVVILEHANKPGKKILMSGGGRCNFTNYEVTAENFISHNSHFCKSALSRYTQWDFIELVKKHKIPFHEKTLGQLFCDNKAKEILEMLLQECAAVNVEIRLDTSVEKIQQMADQHFQISSSRENFQCDSLVIATGGLSIPTMGATAYGYKVAEQFGIPVHPTRAGLVALTLHVGDIEKLSPLAGVSVDSLVTHGSQSFRENILFTHRGISGPAILQISSYWSPGKFLEINLLPDTQLFAELQQHKINQPQKQLNTILYEYLPKRVIDIFISAEHAETRLASLSASALEHCASALQAWLLKPNATEGYRTAEVTLGGVDCDALSSKTMAAHAVSGLYFIGEVADVTGWLGGYNFQWAWSSGWAAGQVV